MQVRFAAHIIAYHFTCQTPFDFCQSALKFKINRAANELPMIEIFPWDKNFETGFPVIDEQHRMLVDMLNGLANSAAGAAGPEHTDELFAALADYAAHHFQTEEELWESYMPGRPETCAHQAEHLKFIAELTAIKANKLHKPHDKLIEDILSFLAKWLAFHILESDKRLGRACMRIRNGQDPKSAAEASLAESGAGKAVLVQTILNMYDSLSNRTLQLMREAGARQAAEERLRMSMQVFDATMDAIAVVDAELRIAEANKAFAQSLPADRQSPASFRGQLLCSFKSGLAALWQEQIRPALALAGNWSGVVQTRNSDGSPVAEWLAVTRLGESAEDAGGLLACVFSNVGSLISKNLQLERMANHDPLTGLPNRLLMLERLEVEIARAERNRSGCAVCFLDLDGFKPVNDRLGHAAGDEVLKTVASRLLRLARSSDSVCRVGGDEFVLIFAGIADERAARELAELALAQISLPVDAAGTRCCVGASIGVSLYPKDATDARDLLLLADEAMYTAKAGGKGACMFSGAAAANPALNPAGPGQPPCRKIRQARANSPHACCKLLALCLLRSGCLPKEETGDLERTRILEKIGAGSEDFRLALYETAEEIQSLLDGQHGAEEGASRLSRYALSACGQITDSGKRAALAEFFRHEIRNSPYANDFERMLLAAAVEVWGL